MPRTPNKCTRCKATFKHHDSFMKHFTKCEVTFQQRAYKRTRISCNQCKKKFLYKKNYLHHKKNEHCEMATSVPCQICPARCPNKKILKEHVTNVHLRITFNCPNCKLSFARKAHVDRHLQQSNCGGVKNNKKFICDSFHIVYRTHPVISIAFRDTEQCVSNTEVSSVEMQGYCSICITCDAICNSGFSRKDNLMNHLRSQHISNAKCYTCKICSDSFKTFARLVTHTQRIHWKKVLFECDTCGKGTTTKNALVKHMEIHGDKRYSCEVCGYTSFTPEILRRHILTHVPDKPFKCDYCPKSFIQLLQLRKHVAKHEVPYACSVCSEKFETEIELTIHSYVHEGKDKLMCHFEGCSEAGTRFRNEKALLKHMKSHTSTYVHRCDVCDKVFFSAAYARRHIATHTLERPRRCMYCVSARAYVRGEALVRHVRKIHPSVFKAHLQHVRNVLEPEAPVRDTRIRRSELEAILSVMDAETERVLAASGGPGTLYAGMAPDEEEGTRADSSSEIDTWRKFDEEESVEELKPLLSIEKLADSLRQLLVHLVDSETLENLGWPEDSVDDVLERVIEKCGAQPADRKRYSRVQRLRENAKHLFLNVVEDKTVANMLNTHTIDQIIMYILNQVATNDNGL